MDAARHDRRIISAATLIFGALPLLAAAQDNRVFMALDGQQHDQPLTGTTTVTMQPGETVTVMIWMETTGDSDLLNAYQLLMPWETTPLEDATGTVVYEDNSPGQPGGDSVHLDITRPDWVFADTVPLPPIFNETPVDPDDRFFGAFYHSIIGTGVDPAGEGTRYLLQFRYTASEDACGHFEARFRTPPQSAPLAALFTPHGTSFGETEYQVLMIEVTDCDEPCNGPCDDGAACTVNDELCSGTCAGQPAVCPFDDCLAMSCDADGVEGNCDTRTPINEWLWCGWFSGDFGTCHDGECIPQDLEQVRVFMVPEPLRHTTPQSGPTYYSMLPGETVTIMAWIEDLVPGDQLRVYDLHWPAAATPAIDATGSVTYVNGPGNGNSVLVDVTREDWLFGGMPTAKPGYIELMKPGSFAARYSTPPGATVDPGASAEVRYLAEFTFRASADASGSFELPFGMDTALKNDDGLPYGVNELQPLVLFVGAPQPLVSLPPNGGTDPVGSPDGDGNNVGRDHIMVYLNGPADTLYAEDLNIASTGPVTPTIEEILPDGDSAVVRFDQPIPAGECTLIAHVPSGWFTKIRVLPGDVNGDGISNPNDIITLVDHLNGVLDPPLADWQCDIDQSGKCNGLDILAEINLLNGAHGGVAWNGVEVPECP